MTAETGGAVAEEDDQAVVDELISSVCRGDGYGSEVRPAHDATGPSIPGRLVRELICGSHGRLVLPRVRINGLVIVGDVDLSYCDWRGELDLSYCRIDGVVRLAHASIAGQVRIIDATMRRLSATYASIEGPLMLRGSHFDEGVYALAANIRGSLNLTMTRLRAPEKTPNSSALELFRARLGDVFLNNSVVEGGIYANGCTVDRNFRLRNAHVTSRQELGWETGPDSSAGAVSLLGATIGAGLYLATRGDHERAWTFAGKVVLTRVSCETLYIRAEEVRGQRIRIEYLTYGRLVNVTPEEWLEVLAELPDVSSQPYAQFAAYCERIGRADMQRAAQIELQKRTTRALPPRSLERLRRRAWEWSVAYGYQPARAIVWLACTAVICVVVLLVGGDFMVEEAAANGRGVHSGPDAIKLALDNLLPFAGLGVARHWSADPRNAAETAWLVAFVCLKFVGWGLAALGLASVTGVMKKA